MPERHGEVVAGSGRMVMAVWRPTSRKSGCLETQAKTACDFYFLPRSTTSNLYANGLISMGDKGASIMNDRKSHVETLIELRAELIRKRREYASKARAEELPDLVAQIDAIDRSIADEKSLAKII